MVDNVAPKQTLGKRPSMEDVMDCHHKPFGSVLLATEEAVAAAISTAVSTAAQANLMVVVVYFWW